jgi:hypothetical protein
VNKTVLSKIKGVNGWLLFLLFTLTMWLFLFVNNEFVVTEQLYESYVEQKMNEKYDDYDKISKEFQDDLDEDSVDENFFTDAALDYAFISSQSAVQFLAIAGFIFVGLTITQSTESIEFASIFKTVMVGEFIFFVPKLIKYLIFLFKKGSYTYEEVKDFNIGSLYSFFNSHEIASWLKYPLKLINLFEVSYIVFLCFAISDVLSINLTKVWRPVAISYLSLLILWMSIRIYLSVIF